MVGRKGRKSAVAACIAAHAAVFCDWRPCLAPGEIGRVVVVAVSKDQARQVRDYALALLESHPDLEALVASSDGDSITLTTGIRIVCVANSFRSIRGPSIVCAIFDEVAFWRSDDSANPDKEVLRAVRPAMIHTRPYGALLIGLSSPYAKRGLLYEKHRDHFGDNDSSVLIWQADTHTMNPGVDRGEIESAYNDDPSAAEAEFGAQFRDDLAEFLDADLLSALARPSPLELLPTPGSVYRAFADPSGGRGDAFALAIAHRERGDGAGRVVVDAVRATRPPFDPASAVGQYADLLKSYGIREVVGDNYGAEWVVSAFAADGITYRPSERSKSQIYLEALPLFTNGTIELPPERGLLRQLAALERRTARGGRDSVDHPRGGHDDIANVACGAALLADDEGPGRYTRAIMENIGTSVPTHNHRYLSAEYWRRIV